MENNATTDVSIANFKNNFKLDRNIYSNKIYTPDLKIYRRRKIRKEVNIF